MARLNRPRRAVQTTKPMQTRKNQILAETTVSKQVAKSRCLEIDQGHRQGMKVLSRMRKRMTMTMRRRKIMPTTALMRHQKYRSQTHSPAPWWRRAAAALALQTRHLDQQQRSFCACVMREIGASRQTAATRREMRAKKPVRAQPMARACAHDLQMQPGAPCEDDSSRRRRRISRRGRRRVSRRVHPTG